MKSPEKIHVLVLGVSLLDGMSVRVKNLVEPLVEDNSIALSNLIYANQRTGDQFKVRIERSVNYKIVDLSIRRPLSIISFFIEGFRFIKRSRAEKGKNILYNYDYPDIKNLFYILYARMLGYKVIIDLIEDFDFTISYSSFGYRLRVLSARLLLKISPLFTDTYIVISTHLKNKVRSFSQKPVHLIPIAVNLDYFNKAARKANEHNEVKLFYGGSFAIKDGLRYLIEAFDELSKRYTNVKLYLTGLGLKEDMEASLAQIGRLEHKDRVFFKGYLKWDDYCALLDECDIFCMTRNNSKYASAGFPFKLGEFLAAGRAVIASRVGDVPKYLTSGKDCLLVEPESVSQLAEAISYFIENRQAIDAMGYNARKTAESNFDSRMLGSRLLQIFRSLDTTSVPSPQDAGHQPRGQQQVTN